MKINRAYKFRIYPNKEQEVLIGKTFGSVRFVYNKMLEDRQNIYMKYRDDKKELKKQKYPTPAKYKTKFEWLTEIDGLSLANAQMNLNAAYSNWWKRLKKKDKNNCFPKFKAKKDNNYSYTTSRVNNNLRIEGKRIKIPKLGLVKAKIHRTIPKEQRIKSGTITKTATGKYYISLLVKYKKQIKKIKPRKSRIIGLDMTAKNLFTDSQCRKADYPGFYHRAQEKLSLEQRKLSRKKKGGANKLKQNLKVARLHEKIANQRKDFLHKKSRELSNHYDSVIVEDLDVKTMSKRQGLKLGKSLADNAWGIFTFLLGYKLKEQGKRLVKIGKWFPSSKMCSKCQTINDKLQLSEKEWICDACGSLWGRDYNAAINIRDEGIRLLGLVSKPTNRRAGGDSLLNLPIAGITQEAPTSKL